MRLMAILTVTGLAFGAAPIHTQWEVGGVVGINLASISVDPEPSSEDYSGRLGFGFGFVADRELTDQIDLHFEPMFLMKGSTIKEDGDEISQKLSYLEVPVMVRYHFEAEGTARPYVMGGPSLGFLLSAKYDGGFGEQDAKDETKSIDFGVGVGAGVAVPQGDKTFFAEARYVLGLTNINDEIHESGESTVKNRGIQLFVGATIPVGR